MNKRKTLSKTTVAVGAIAAAGLAGVVLALKEEPKNNREVYVNKEFGQIKQFENKIVDYLNSHIDPKTKQSTLSKETQDELYGILLEIQHNKQNPDYNSLSAQQLANKLDRDFDYALLNDAIRKNSQEGIEKALEDITNQIKDPELKAQFLDNNRDIINSLKNGDINEAEKLELANKLKEQTQGIFDRQNEIIVPAQNILWKIKDELAENPENYKPEDKAKVQGLINALEAALDLNTISAENVSQLTDDLENALANLSEIKKETELEYQKYLNKSEIARQNILDSNLSNAEKEKLLAKVDKYDEAAASKDLTYANNKLDDLKELEKLVDSIQEELNDQNKDKSTLKDEIKAIIDAAPTLDHANLNDTLISDLAKISEALNDPNISKDKLIELKKDAKAKIDFAQSQQKSIDNTNALIDQAKENNLISTPQETELKDEMTSINGEDLLALSEDENEKIDDVIEKLTRAQKINSDLEKLQALVESKLPSEFADKPLLNEILAEAEALKAQSLEQWDDLDGEEDRTWEAEDKVAELFDKLRDANKNELKNLIAAGQDAQNNPDVSPAIKEALKALETVSTPLTNDYSSATSKQIEPRIEEYKKLLDDARLSEKVAQINKETNAFKDTIPPMADGNDRNTQANLYKDKIDALLNKINTVHSDPNLTNEEKEAQIDELYDQIKALESPKADLQKLMDEQDKLLDIIASLDANPEIKRQLLSEINDADRLLNAQNDVFKNPDQNDIEREVEKVKELEDLIKEKRNKLISDQYYQKALKAINDGFAPYRNGVIPSELEKKFKAELEKQKAILDDPNTDQAAYDAAVAAIKKLQDNIKAAADLEKERLALQDEIRKTEDMGLGANKPAEQIAQAQAKLDEINDFINNLTDPAVGTGKYGELKAAAIKEKEDLQIAQEKAKFKNALDDLKTYITPSEENDPAAYKELEKLITDNITNQQNLAEGIVNPSTNAKTIQDTTEKVQNNIPLAAKLKEAQAKYKELVDTYPEVAAQLKAVIEANTINLNDPSSEIDAKIQRIAEELNKIEAKKRVADALKEIEKVYSEDDADKAIFATSKPNLENKIAAFKEKFANPDLTAAELVALQREIERANNLGATEKQNLEKALDDKYKEAKALYDELALEATSKRGIAEDSLDKLNAAWAKIAAQKEGDNFINAATPEQIEQLMKEMKLEYLKDVFEDKKAKIEAVKDAFPETTSTTNGDTSPTEKLAQNIQDSMDNWLEKVNSEDPKLTEAQLNEYISKMDSLKTYADESTKLLDAYGDTQNKEEIINAINENLIDPNADDKAVIQAKAENLNTARYNAVEEEKLRKQVNDNLEALKAEIPADSYGTSQLAGLTELLDKKQEELANAQGKDAIKAIEDVYKKINQNIDEIKVLAGNVDSLDTKIKEALAETQDPKIEALQNRFNEDLQKRASAKYTNPDSKQISELNEEVKNYEALLNAIKDFDKNYENVKAKLEAIDYADGFGNIDNLTFKINEEATEESFSNLTKESVKAKMLASLEVFKNFADSIDYANTQVNTLEIKKELAIISVSLENFKNLVTAQEEVINTDYTNVKDNATAKKAEFSNLNVSPDSLKDFGFDFDAKNIGESILNSEIAAKEEADNLNYTDAEAIKEQHSQAQEENQTIQAKIAADKAKLEQVTSTIDDLVTQITRYSNQVSLRVKELEVAKERVTELQAQRSYDSSLSENTITNAQAKVVEIEAQIVDLKEKLATSKTQLQEAQDEAKKAFYQIQYDLFKYKQNLDLQNKLAEALFTVASQETNNDTKFNLKNTALTWKNEVINTKISDLQSELEEKIALFTNRQIKIQSIRDNIETLNEKLSKDEPKYAIANSKISQAYLDILNYISESYTTTDLDNYTDYISAVNKVVDPYKIIADKVSDLEAKVTEIEADDYAKENAHMKSLLDQVKEEISFIKGDLLVDSRTILSIYQNNVDQNIINEWKRLLQFQIDKLEFYKAYVASQKTLDSYKVQNKDTALANSENVFLEANESAPLQKILNDIFKEIYYTNSYYSSEEFNKNFKEKYLTGESDTSLKVALANSINLKKVLTKAEAIYAARKVSSDGANADTALMNDLYVQLNQEIAKAKEQLTKLNHDEISKSLEIDKIDDGSTGLIAKLKDQKLRELKAQLANAKDVKSYVDSNYGFNNGPKMDDFEAQAIEQLQTLSDNQGQTEEIEFIKQSNQLIEQSKAKIKAQLLALFEYERNSLRSLLVRSKQYAQIFKGVDSEIASKSIDKAELAKLYGLSSSDIESLITSIQAIESFDPALWNIDNDYTNSTASYSESQYENYTDTINEIKEKRKDLNSKYTLVKQTTTLKLKSFKTEFDEAKKELTAPSAGADGTTPSNLRTIINDMHFDTSSSEYLSSFLDTTSFDNATNSTQGTNPLDEPVNDADKDALVASKNKFLDYSKAILEQNTKWNKLIFGDSETDNKALKNIYIDYIQRRSQIDEYLNLWLDTNAVDQRDTIFAEFKKQFNVQSAQAEKIKNDTNTSLVKKELDASDLNSPSMVLLKVKRALSSAKGFRDWLNSPVNKQDLFEYLYNKPSQDSYHYNYNDLELVTGKYADDWTDAVSKIQDAAYTTVRVGGVDKKALLVDGQSFLDLFSKFSIVKQNSKIFNNSNVKVYLYIDEDGQPLLTDIVQANPSYKNVKYNILVKFTMPTNNNDSTTSVFNDTGEVVVYWTGVESRFKTYSEIKINNDWFSSTKGFFKTDWSKKMSENWKSTPVENLPGAVLFDYAKGGVTPETAPSVIVSGYNDLQSLYNEQTYLPMYSEDKLTELKGQSFEMNDPFVELDPNLKAAKARVSKYPANEQAEQWAQELKKWKRTLDIQKERININISAKNGGNFRYKGKTYAKSADLTFWRLLPSDNYGSISYVPHLIAIPVYDVDSKKMGIILWLFEIVPSSSANYFIAGIPWANRSIAYVSNSYTYSDTDAAENYKKSLQMAKDVLSEYVNKNTAYAIANTTGGPSGTTTSFPPRGAIYFADGKGASDATDDGNGMTFASNGFVNTFNIDYMAKIYKSDLELQNNEERETNE
ncbi:hypothetical protein [Mycoplasmopsis gallinacea]|uniref:ECM-binding protein homolog n=1 Tax=Mycoplasmopsis gallinacea TaxID=29556 RepID=A0A6H0V636_9BACT|nr:hypothetical protein [Mycoplasmopsis gallinacea]QIW62497.1 hypothetical protein GOQ20_03700 [Mycoplasmopsis gallinacea]